MIRIYNLSLSIVLLLGLTTYTHAQSVYLGSVKNFITSTKAQASNSKLSGGKSMLHQKVSETDQLDLEINFEKGGKGVYMVGTVTNHKSSNFFISASENEVIGNIVLKEEKKAYKYSADEHGAVFIKEVDIHEVLCVEFDEVNTKSSTSGQKATAAAQPDLQSLPGATAVVYLDFDGEYVSGTPWNGGNPINAVSRNYSNAQIAEIWERVAQDFYAFQVNVTTNRSVFDAAPRNRRMMTIFTTTNTAAPGSGGVAYMNSFTWNDNTPCWVFNGGIQTAATTASHEVGHTLGLGHDGRTSPSEGYYNGHGDWGPIMGAAFGKRIDHWSKGEYANANNHQDDIAIIASPGNGFGFRADDHAGNTGGATTLQIGSNGNINGNNVGIIGQENDIDMFKFTTGGGNVNFTVAPRSAWTNLDVEARLLNASGAVIASSSNPDLSANINVNVGAGTYYIRVDGIGTGNPTTGYLDYASTGDFQITGNIPPGVNPPPSGDAVVTLHEHCNMTGTAVGLARGDFNLGQLQALGYGNDGLSSISVKKGYKTRVYEHDNFTGNSVLLTSSDNCLVDNGFNDLMTSIRVRPNGQTGLSGQRFFIKNRKSGKYLDVANWGTDNGANILQWHYHGGANQQFEFQGLGDGVYVIRNVHSGKAMDIGGISKANGANLLQWDYVGGDNQKFIVYNNTGNFYQLIPLHSSKCISVDGNSNNAGANVHQWDNNDQLAAQWELVPVPTPDHSVFIQAEDYNNMAGVQTEPTTDDGGGINVGWIDAGDWMAYYDINFPETANYLIEYRVASPGGSVLSADLNAGSIQLGTVNIPATGGWQNWTTVSHTVGVNAGTYQFGVFAPQSGWNINWIRITKVSGGAVAAESSEMLDNDPTELRQLDTYPNPAFGELNIADLDGSLSGGQMVISSMQGQVIYEGTFQSKVSLNRAPAGIYTVKVISVDGTLSISRFLKE